MYIEIRNKHILKQIFHNKGDFNVRTNEGRSELHSKKIKVSPTCSFIQLFNTAIFYI